MKNPLLKICDATIQAGESANLALPLPDYNSCSSFYMPIKVVHGKKPGPCVVIFSGIEGNEFNGLEIINRLLLSEDIDSISGTLIAVPVMNILGLINPVSLPYEKNIEKCFPGDENGSYGQRIAQIFTQEILSKATHCIELKTGGLNDDILPQVYCDIENIETKTLAKHFEAPVISHILQSTSLRQTAESLNIPLIVYKAGEAMRFDEAAIKLGIKGIKNVLVYLEMLSRENNNETKTVKPVFSQEQDWLRAHRSGILLTNVTLGQYIEQNDTIGRITDPFSANTVEPVKATQDGIIVGINRNPLIFEGQNIFKIASFIDNNRAELTLEQWNQIQQQEELAIL